MGFAGGFDVAGFVADVGGGGGGDFGLFDGAADEAAFSEEGGAAFEVGEEICPAVAVEEGVEVFGGVGGDDSEGRAAGAELGESFGDSGMGLEGGEVAVELAFHFADPDGEFSPGDVGTGEDLAGAFAAEFFGFGFGKRRVAEAGGEAVSGGEDGVETVDEGSVEIEEDEAGRRRFRRGHFLRRREARLS